MPRIAPPPAPSCPGWSGVPGFPPVPKPPHQSCVSSHMLPGGRPPPQGRGISVYFLASRTESQRCREIPRGRGPFTSGEVSPTQDVTLPLVMRFPEDRAVSSPLAEAPSDQGVISGLQQAGNKSAGPVLPSRAWAPLDTKVSLPRSPIHPAPPFPDPRNQVQGAHPQDAPVPASSYGAAVPSPIQAKEKVEGRGRNAQFPSPGSDLLVLCARAPGGQFRGGIREQSCRHQREPVSPALSASWG